MSILVLSASHRTTSLDNLARLALDGEQRSKLTHDLHRSEGIDEALILATCNRTEIYACVDRFHAGLEHLAQTLSATTGVPLDQLQAACSVSYDERAVQHAFAVTSGLESMVRGEAQILGQVRAALGEAQRAGAVGTALNALFQQALRVGKRVQHETSAGAAGRSLITAALDATPSLNGRRVLIVGAGSMATLAAHTCAAAGAELALINRTKDRADVLARAVAGRAHDEHDLTHALRQADVVITCRGAGQTLTTADLAGTPVRHIIDLGLPADVDPAVAGLPGVTLINLATLASTAAAPLDLADAERLVAEEVADFLAARRSAAVTPTVVALRTMAGEILAAELDRLNARAPDLTDAERAEVGRAMRRVVDKLLHQPTVRVRELSTGAQHTDYAGALRELFALDAEAVRQVVESRT